MEYIIINRNIFPVFLIYIYMKNILYSFYFFLFNVVEENDNSLLLEYNKDNYIFKKVYINNNDLKRKLEILKNSNIYFYDVIFNKAGEFITTIDNNNYILYKLDNNYPINNNIINYININEREDTYNLWCKKIDYYYTQVIDFNVKKEELINLFNYYAGFGEIAISLLDSIRLLNCRNSISRKINIYPIDYNLYYDPTNIIFDYSTRELAEYIKYTIINNKFNINEILNIIDINNFNNIEIIYLIARVMYPNYFFNIFEDNIISEEDYDYSDFYKYIELFESNIDLLLKSLQKKYDIPNIIFRH